MIYDFSELNQEQVEQLKKLVNDAILDLPDEDWVNLYNCIYADRKYPKIYANNKFTVNQVLKSTNIWGLLSNLEKTRQYSVEDAWFSIRKGILYSDDIPQKLLWNFKDVSAGMATLLVENYADDFDMAELADVMKLYTADYDDEEE